MGLLTRLPLRRRIMVLVTVGAGLSVALMAILGLQATSQVTARILQERRVMARVTAANLDERLGAALSRLEAVAATYRWDIRAGLPRQALDLLAANAARPGFFSGGFLVVDRSRHIVWPPQQSGGSVDPAALGRVLAGEPSVSGLTHLPRSQVPLAIMWVPLRGADGEVSGALGGIIDLQRETLLELIRPLVFGRTGHAVILDADGIVLAGTEKHERFTRGEHPDFFIGLIRSQRADVARTPEIEDGVIKDQHIMAFAPLGTGRWGIGFGQTEAEVFFHERALRHRILLLGVFLIGAGLLAAWWDTGTMTRPLRRLTESAGRIAGGDLASPIPPEQGYEVGLLADTLESMRANLARARAELEARTAAMEQQTAQTRALYEVSRAILSEAHLTEVLSTIATATRTLLGAEAAAVCLWDQAASRLIPGAFDGPARAFESPNGGVGCADIALDGMWRPATDCPFVRTEFRRAHIAAQVWAGSRLIGFMCAGSTRDRSFGEKDTTLLTSLAGLAALAIESARLRARVQDLAVLEERERIGRDLHDSTIQSLYGITLTLEHAQHLLASRPSQAASRLQQAMEGLAQVIKDIRAYVMGLHEVREDDTLPQVLERAAREFRVNNLLPVEVRTQGEVPDLSPDDRLHLELLVREALANVVRHAGPARAEVVLSADDGTVRIAVTDNGCGFDPAAPSSGLGLRTMAERARRLGGSLVIHSAPGQGTTVEVTVPVRQERGVPA
ncbi:MAG TPA: ATP-binding protein [bacterium]|nr:ATP-binding protein [bacterium]